MQLKLKPKQCAATFFCKFAKTCLFIFRFSSYATVLTNTKQLPIDQWLNASGVHLVN